LIRDLNFGVMKIDWKKKKMNIQIRGEEDVLLIGHTMDF